MLCVIYMELKEGHTPPPTGSFIYIDLQAKLHIILQIHNMINYTSPTNFNSAGVTSHEVHCDLFKGINELCATCKNKCKQYENVKVIYCPTYEVCKIPLQNIP